MFPGEILKLQGEPRRLRGSQAAACVSVSGEEIHHEIHERFAPRRPVEGQTPLGVGAAGLLGGGGCGRPVERAPC